MQVEARYEINAPDIVAEDFGTEIVVLNLISGRYFSLTGVAVNFWRDLAGGFDPRELVAMATAARPVLGASAASLLASVIDAGLMRLRPDRPAPEGAPGIATALAAIESIPPMEAFDDMADLILSDPIHDVDEEFGWPVRRTPTPVTGETPRGGGEPVATFAQELLHRAIDLPRAGLHRLRLELRGLRIEAFFTDAAYAAMCERNLARMPAGDNALDVTLFLLDSASLDWPRPPVPPAAWIDRPALADRLAAADLKGAFLHDTGSWQFFAPAARLGVQLVRAPGDTPPWEAGGPLRAFLHWASAMRGARLCHAAALGEDGRGILLAGPGGSGKSGTTLAGIAAGLSTVGDDYCLVEQGDKVEAYPVFRILKQDPAGYARVYGVAAAAAAGPVNWQGKLDLHASAFAATSFVEKLRIDAVVIPKVAGLPVSGMRPVSAGLAMRAFAPSSVFQLAGDERGGLAFVGDLCRRLPCHELLLSPDPDDVVRAVRGLIKATEA